MSKIKNNFATYDDAISVASACLTLNHTLTDRLLQPIYGFGKDIYAVANIGTHYSLRKINKRGDYEWEEPPEFVPEAKEAHDTNVPRHNIAI